MTSDAAHLVTQTAGSPCGETLTALTEIRPLYFVPTDPLAEEVLIPGFRAARRVDCMAGFFSSAVLSELAPGLASFIANAKGRFRLVISPYLKPEDQAAIEAGTKAPQDVADAAFEELIVTEDLLESHALRCLSHLLKTGRIEIKIAVMKDALFHPKVWLFERDGDVMAAHGSSNLTFSGVRKNFEQIKIEFSWEDAKQRYVIDKLKDKFEALWANKDDDCIVVNVSDALKEKIIRNFAGGAEPSEDDFLELYRRAAKATGGHEMPPDPVIPAARVFRIPEWLNYTQGAFEHQGRAVDAWREAGFEGVLEMATGSGKTITAMICAHKLYEERKPLLIVISAPYVPLIQQWCDEIEPFGLRPVNLTVAGGARGRAQELSRIKRRFRNGSSDVEAVVVSHRTLCDPGFKAELEKFDCARLLIADEAHNLGSEGFITDPPSFFEHRLGLSATPVRQYDEDGTEALFAFFGAVVFRFTLKEAIGRCLVEYDYYVHPVELTHDEMDEWYDITAKIKANAWRNEGGKPDEYLSKLFRDRRALLENAHNKIDALADALAQEELRTLRHALIYASDKAPEQIEAVNALLNERGVLFHQLTYEETASREETARIIRSFQDGTLRVLTAKRVLDEGVNIPQIRKAYILASTTVERQWVQRRGRLLRTCKEIGKTHSEIHDFVALPPDLENIDSEARALVRSELLRVQEFASLARNAGRAAGPLDVIHKLVNAAFL